MIDRTHTITLVVCFLFCLNAIGQERFPLSFSLKGRSADRIPTKTLPPIPQKTPASMRAEGKSPRYLKRLEFGSTLATRISINTEGRSDTVSSTIIHRIMVKSEGAKCLTLKLSIEKGKAFDSQNIFVYNPSQTYVASTLTKLSDQSTMVLPLVPGDCAVVEIEKPIGSKASFTISEVVHGDRLPLKGYGSDSDVSQSCMVDVACLEGQNWQIEKNSIVKILTNTSMGVRLCSGVLVNNTAKDKHPYLLTAHHCILSEEDAKNSVFYFGYEKKECGTNIIVQGNSISGANLVATGYQGKVDFSLVELSQTPPIEFQPYYAGWDIRKNPFTQPRATCLHHPNGDVKKISVDYDTPTPGDYTELDPFAGFDPNTHWHIAQWDVGATEGGSSGSALFNYNHQVVGNLTGGLSDCTNPVDDYYSRIDVAWNSNSDPSYQLKKWLDPAMTGDSTIAGMQPSSTAYTVQVSSATPCDGDTVTLGVTPQEPNLILTNLRADNANEVSGEGTHKLVWSIKNLGDKRDIVADFVLNGANIGSAFIASVKERPLKPSIEKSGITLSTTSTLQNQWYLNSKPISSITPQSAEISGAGKYYVVASNEFGCTTQSDAITVEYSDEIDSKNVSVYPVPVGSGIIHIKTQVASGNTYSFLSGTLVVSLYDMLGRKLGTNTYKDPADVIDYELPTSVGGLYLLEIVANGKRFTKKIIIEGM